MGKIVFETIVVVARVALLISLEPFVRNFTLLKTVEMAPNGIEGKRKWEFFFPLSLPLPPTF